MEFDVSGGKFITEEGYQAYTSGGSVGAEMSLRFKPVLGKLLTLLGVTRAAAMGPCAIDLIQIVREIHLVGGPLAAAAGQGNLGYADRMVPIGASQGWGIDMEWQAAGEKGFKKISAARVRQLNARIDQLRAQPQPLSPGAAQELADLLEHRRQDRLPNLPAGTAVTSLDPRYAQQRLSELVPRFTTYEQEETTGNAFVWDGAGSFPPDRFARLRDRPGIPSNDPMLGMEFQVAALLETPQLPLARRYLGSVSWGWRRAAAGQAPTADACVVVSANGVSQAFLDAVAHWNTLTVPDPGGAGAVRPVIQL